jgi:hypothetical protein
MTRVLTERQQKFLDVLFDEAEGDVVAAKMIAGYSKDTATSYIINSMKDEIADATKVYLARIAPRAASALYSGIVDPTQLGLKDKLSAAKDILDRSGFSKTEKIDVGTGNALFILPAKDKNED